MRMSGLMGFVLTVLFAVALCVHPAAAADWRQFRGNDTNNLAADEDQPPAEVDDSRIAWTAELPGRGLSGPIIVGDRVYLTASSGFRQDRLHVLCFDSDSGELLWERQFWATGRTMCHRKMCVATPTPASDGKRIFASYSSNDVVCLDLEGNLLWVRGLTHDFPNASNSLGMASSPIVVGDTLIVQVESDADSFTTGLDVQTGVSRWKIARPQRANWTSPIVYRSGERTLVLLQSSAGLHAVEPRTGEVVWAYEEGAATIPSGVVADSLIIIPSHGLTALRPVPGGSPPEIVWRNGALGPSTPSVVAYHDQVFSINRVGVLSCADVADGRRRWQIRLKGPFSATPVVAGDRLYCVNEDGLLQIVRVGGRGRIVDDHDFEETILATPAVAHGALYLRSDAHLWKVSD